MLDILNDQTPYYLCTEVDVEKSYKESGEGKRYIFGIATSTVKDEDGEIILHKFVDLEPFVERGFFTYEHLKDPEYIVGFPYKDECRVADDGVYVAGELFANHPVADKIWDLIVYLKKHNIPRRLYFSIEGKAYRNLTDPPGIIRKVRVYDVSITRRPANPQAILDAVVKSVVLEDGQALYVVNPHDMTSGISALRREVVDSALKVLTYLLDHEEDLREELRKKGELNREEALIYALLTFCPKLRAILESFGGVSH